MHNSRIITLRQAATVFFKLVFWIPITALSLLLVYNTIPYFSFQKTFPFIEERSILFGQSVYQAAFYIHIFAGAVCILTALIQFSRYILKRSKAIHRWSGRLYAGVVLFLGAPTGLYMSFFAKGSFWERCLFMAMAICWFVTTLYGVATVRKKNILAHKIWMIRSYAMALTAVSFRVYHILFYKMGWDHLENYQLSLWISVLGNMLAAEWIIYRKSRTYLKSFTT